MTDLAKLINRVGEDFDARHEQDFGLESAERVADFYNNGGLEFHNNGLNYAIQYASLEDGLVQVGSWVWEDDEDFDADATFEVYDEDDFSAEELQAVYDKVKEIYLGE